MAKKYLLYIHDARFDKEQKKSQLVNQLLEFHYGGRKIKLNGDISKSRLIIKGMVRASEMECPRHHVPFKVCEYKH